jgi:multidrug efflux pump subunit AcrA (membrane-fusion protein)
VEPEKAFIEIIDLSEVYAHASVPEHRAGKMKIGTEAQIHIPAVPDQVFTGKLLRFGTSANHKSGSIDAVFQISNKDGRIRPEMCAEFSIVTAKRENVLSIPREALQGEVNERHVFVKDFDLPNAFIKSPVKVGDANERVVEIVSGVLSGDDVVTQGAYSLGFVEKGSMSLKEALDAAHGHEHAADGSELEHDEGKHEDEHDHSESPLWKIISAVLFLLLLISLFLRPKSTSTPEAR